MDLPQFKEKIEKMMVEKCSDIVLALDFPLQDPKDRKLLLDKAEAVMEAAQPYIGAVKINHHLVLPLGTFDGVQSLVKKAHDKGLLAIMDCKVNDIGTTNQTIADYYYAAGFDALIANPFVGWEEGLQPVFETARKQGRGVILLTYMSHKGAAEGYGQTIVDNETRTKIPQYVSFARKALKWQADGVVVGATAPAKIREINEILRARVPIYSPGVGAQGGQAATARNAGARYLIVGREITMANDPAAAAKKVALTQE
jgi:orotidine-5'-phosphate decarboxylase